MLNGGDSLLIVFDVMQFLIYKCSTEILPSTDDDHRISCEEDAAFR